MEKKNMKTKAREKFNKYCVRLDPPEDYDGARSLYVTKIGGEGPGWTLTPEKDLALEVPEHDAARILDRLPLVATIRVEQGWSAGVVRLRKKKVKRPNRDQAVAGVTASPVAKSPLDLLHALNDLRLQAEKIAGEQEIDTPAGYWTSDLQGKLAQLVRQGAQLLQGGDQPE